MLKKKWLFPVGAKHHHISLMLIQRAGHDKEYNIISIYEKNLSLNGDTNFFFWGFFYMFVE